MNDDVSLSVYSGDLILMWSLQPASKQPGQWQLGTLFACGSSCFHLDIFGGIYSWKIHRCIKNILKNAYLLFVRTWIYLWVKPQPNTLELSSSSTLRLLRLYFFQMLKQFVFWLYSECSNPKSFRHHFAHLKIMEWWRRKINAQRCGWNCWHSIHHRAWITPRGVLFDVFEHFFFQKLSPNPINEMVFSILLPLLRRKKRKD